MRTLLYGYIPPVLALTLLLALAAPSAADLPNRLVSDDPDQPIEIEGGIAAVQSHFASPDLNGEKGLVGRMYLTVAVDADGTVSNVEVIRRPSTDGRSDALIAAYDEAAIHAVQQSTFHPAEKEGEAVASEITLWIQLRDAEPPAPSDTPDDENDAAVDQSFDIEGGLEALSDNFTAPSFEEVTLGGRIFLSLTVEADGTPSDVEILHRAIPSDAAQEKVDAHDNAVQEAVDRTTFIPATRDGESVSQTQTVWISM